MAVPTLAPGGSRPQPKTTKKKPADPWMGAAHGTSMGAGSTSALKAYQAANQTSPSMPAAPQVDSVTALPPDATYSNQVSLYGKSRDDALAALAGQRTASLADYGYGASFGDDGALTGLKVDPNNPYSKAAQLQRSYDNAKRGTTNSLAERGLGSSGAMVNAQNANDTGYSTSKDTLEKNLGAILAGILGQERSAKSAYEANAANAYGDWLGRAPSNPAYAPTPGAPGGPAPATSSSVIDDPHAGMSTADKVKLLQQYGAVNSYTNAQGHKVRTFADGHKEVLIDGKWKRV